MRSNVGAFVQEILWPQSFNVLFSSSVFLFNNEARARARWNKEGMKFVALTLKKKKNVRKTNMLEFAVKLLVNLHDSAFLLSSKGENSSRRLFLGFDSTGREAGGVGMFARHPSSFRSYFAVTISSAALGEGRSHPEPEPPTLPSISVVEKKG